jgi:hypothetical protein
MLKPILIPLFLLLSSTAFSTNAPPLTTIDATQTELDAFIATVEGGLLKINANKQIVVHLVGASEVEASIDWSPLCEKYNIEFLLVGPKLPNVTSKKRESQCTHYHKSLYSRRSLAESNLNKNLLIPDLVIGFNVDIYMIYWRRTLGELIQLRKPIIVTVYCAYEGHKLVRLMKWRDQEFSPAALSQCDTFNKVKIISNDLRSDADIPEIITLWDFTENPHAHAKPKNCYNKKIMEGFDYGVRNSFWIGFQGKENTRTNKEL